MPSDDDGGLGPQLENRLRDELDRVQPRFSSPRYLAAKHRPVVWRLAPAALAAAVVAMLGLTAYAGSANPVVWTEHVVTVLHPSVASPTPSEHGASPEPTETSEQHESPEPSEKPESGESPEPSQSPEPRESPEPSQSPEPSDGHSGSGSGDSGSGSGSGSGSSGESSPSPTPSGDH